MITRLPDVPQDNMARVGESLQQCFEVIAATVNGNIDADNIAASSMIASKFAANAATEGFSAVKTSTDVIDSEGTDTWKAIPETTLSFTTGVEGWVLWVASYQILTDNDSLIRLRVVADSDEEIGSLFTVYRWQGSGTSVSGYPVATYIAYSSFGFRPVGAGTHTLRLEGRTRITTGASSSTASAGVGEIIAVVLKC